MSHDLDADRAAFRHHVAESDRYAEAADADSANAETDKLAALAEHWEQQGRAVEFLTPLLAPTELRPVRFNAASWLLYRGHPDVAVPVLEELRAGRGLEGVDAGLLLDDWRAGHSARGEA
ncbi:hypothetical protein [Flindersiella endophytica]